MSKLDKIEELQRLIKENTQDFQLRRQLAVLLIDCGFNEEALKHLLYLSKMTQDDGVYYNLGIVYEKMKNFKKAKEAYKKSLELAPNSADSIYNLGLVLTELQEYEEAIECFNKILKNEPNDSNTYFNLGLVYFKQKDLQNAFINFQKTVQLNDSDLYAHFYLGNIYKEVGKPNNAKAEFKKVIQISPDYSWAYFNLACISYEKNDIPSAVANLKKTIEMNPYDFEAYSILTKILIKSGQAKQANNIVQMAFNQCEETGDLDYLAAMVYKNLNDKESYMTYLNNAIKNYQSLSIPLQKVKNELAKARNTN